LELRGILITSRRVERCTPLQLLFPCRIVDRDLLALALSLCMCGFKSGAVSLLERSEQFLRLRHMNLEAWKTVLLQIGEDFAVDVTSIAAEAIRLGSQFSISLRHRFAAPIKIPVPLT
jgi:hypothetical protein